MNRKTIIILTACISLFLSSCKQPGKPVEIELDVPENAGINTDAQAVSPPDKWWEEFNDEKLNSLMESALDSNLTLNQMWQRVEQSKAAAKIAGASLYPSVNLTGEASRTRSETDAARSYKSLYSTGLVVNYELDIWGRVEANAAAGVYEWAASEQDMNAAKISIASQVANAWFSIIERRGQLKLLDEQIRINSDSLDLIEIQFKRGQAETTDVLQQRQLLESKRGEKRLVEAQLEVFENQLAVLTGKSPGKLEIPSATTLPVINDTQNAGLAGDLVNRRPDIQAAYLRVQAADRKTAALVADRLPKLSLGASLATSDDQITGLFDNWQAAIAADALMPLFDAGRRKTIVEQQRAVTKQAVYNYTDTVIQAIREVRDAMILEKRQKEYIESLEKQIELSKKSVSQIKENYLKGATDYLRFLSAQLTDQNLERQYLTAKKDLVSYRVDLYKALAGSTENNYESEISN